MSVILHEGRNESRRRGKNVEETLEDRRNGGFEGEWKTRMRERGEGRE